MSDPARNPSRFLPTLTEVVAPSPPVAAPTPELEQIVQSVLQRLDGVIERRLAEELERVVREVVAQTMNASAHPQELE
ncbi:MAG: hypothetical protein PHS32_22215 [Rhodoferax sp.]|uniref:hypothetical protein n=1 Tax=Rhodoferax sp. TaxID=50421 RepID=UPI00260C97E8|nr:hypothetical protein [Rhodoferax sp.]MDD5336462.1 hypothetical protein [Rhodoferax sp.]